MENVRSEDSTEYRLYRVQSIRKGYEIIDQALRSFLSNVGAQLSHFLGAIDLRKRYLSRVDNNRKKN
jgi:hypothetical protein